MYYNITFAAICSDILFPNITFAVQLSMHLPLIYAHCGILLSHNYNTNKQHIRI